MKVFSKKRVFWAALCLIVSTVIYHSVSNHGSLSQQREPERSSVWSNVDARTVTTATKLQAVELPCSLRVTVRAHPLLRRFNFSVPVLQWGGSLSQESWQRLRSRSPPYGWKDLPLTWVRSALGLLNGAGDAALFERRSPGRCVRCAVVGNGGILRGSKRGPEIDGHDLVFRVNGAVTRGFVEDVGTRTSFYGFTTNTMKNSLAMYRREGFTEVPQGPDTRYIFIPSGIRDYVMMASAIEGRTVPTGDDIGDRPSKYFGTKRPGDFKMLHPDFISYVTRSFLDSPLRTYGKTSHLYMPSTGALMLLTALHTCDQVSAYGFITRNYADFSDHYYDAARRPLRFFANHDMRMENWLWEALDDKKVLRLYKRNATSE